jgi:hypothetical protein
LSRSMIHKPFKKKKRSWFVCFIKSNLEISGPLKHLHF